MVQPSRKMSNPVFKCYLICYCPRPFHKYKGYKKDFFFIKWSSLVEPLYFLSGFRMVKQDGDHSKTGYKLCPKDSHLEVGMPGF
jgi:hypothetical protein